MTDSIKSLHDCWCQTTGQELHFKATERLFYELWKMEFKPDDLLCVLKHCLAYNKSHAHAQMKIQVHKLIGDLEVFASILAEARAKERNKIPKPTPAAQTLAAWRGCEQVVNNGNGRHISEVFEEMRKATQ